MPSIISAGTTAGSAIALTGDTTGNLAFQTNGTTTAMTIDTSQNVGIGTTSPNALLTIAAASTDTRIRLVGRSADGTSAIRYYSADNATQYGFLSFGNAYAEFNYNGSGYMGFATNNTERMRITSTGNVGIGETSPNNTLSIKAAVATTLLTSSTGTNTVYTQYTNSVGSFYVGRDNSTGGTFGAAYGSYLYSEGAYPLVIWINGSERMRVASDGSVGIGVTNPNSYGKLAVNGSVGITAGNYAYFYNSGNTNYSAIACVDTTGMAFYTASTERMRIDSSGNLLVGKTSPTSATIGCEMRGNGIMTCTRASGPPLSVNRTTDDGDLVSFQQDGTQEGSISVSGTTVSYNGGHLSRWSQLPNNQKDDTLLKGTVMSNLDDMCVWVKDGETLPNEQLNKMKVSDVEGDTNVAGVFVNWTFDEECQSEDMNVAMTGDMIIRIAEGVVVQKGDLLMSAGDGTAKPQGDDIRRSKTVAKVTSNHVTCTYADGSYCVPCVLMAC